MSKEYDAVVVGAGPAGSVTARELARRGHSVLLLEKRERVGFPVRCGEASTTFEDLQKFGPISEECIESEIHGIYVYGNAGTFVDYKKKNLGVMLNREKFDPLLAELAKQDGADLKTGAKAEDFCKNQDGSWEVSVLENSEIKKVKTKMIVGADGVESFVGRKAKLAQALNPLTTCCGIDLKIEGLLTNPEYLTFWQGHDWINDGYIWSFPKVKSNTTNFGAGFLIPKKEAPSILEVTLKYLKELFPDAKILGQVGGLIPVSGNLKEYVSDALVLVGDAAHHTNPLTGGGISAAMKAGRIAAQVISEGLKANNLSRTFLKKYEVLVDKEFGKKHEAEHKFRRFLLAESREEQMDTYRVLNAAVGNKMDLVKHLYTSLKVAFKYCTFK